MKRYALLLTVLISTLFATAKAQQSSGDSGRSAELVLMIGGRQYEVTIGETLNVMTPSGERVALVVKQKQTLSYSGAGMSFDYPRLLKLSMEEQQGVDVIYLRSRGSALGIIQSYSVPTSDSDVRRKLVAGLTQQFKSSGAEFVAGSGRMVNANIGGAKRPGQQLDYRLNGQAMKTEVYSFRHHDRVIAMVFQYADDDAATAGPMFSLVTNTFR